VRKRFGVNTDGLPAVTLLLLVGRHFHDYTISHRNLAGMNCFNFTWSPLALGGNSQRCRSDQEHRSFAPRIYFRLTYFIERQPKGRNNLNFPSETEICIESGALLPRNYPRPDSATKACDMTWVVRKRRSE